MPSRDQAARPHRTHVALALSGIGLVAVTSIVGSGFNRLAIPFAFWSAVPYVALWAAGRIVQDRWMLGGAGAAALSAELGIRGAVFLWPRGSTAAVALVFSPAYIMALVMPAGAVAGWISGKAWHWHAAGRLLVVTAAPIALALLTLGLARPDLFPTTVAARRAALERIGPPRVVAGADAFEWIPVSGIDSLPVTAELDGKPGEELAVVSHRGARIIDSTTFDVMQRVELDSTPVTLWGPFSTMVRLPDGRLAVVQTGGGFSRTLLQALDGTELWEYRPDPRLSPDALRPADLDEDGRVEFYAVSMDGVARLDESGAVIWRRPAYSTSLIALLPRGDEQPAWVAALEYGRRALVWSPDGELLFERAIQAADAPLTAADTFAGRVLIHGGASARGYDQNGMMRFEIPLGDFTLSQALGVGLSPGDAPSLVLVGVTDRHTSRYRLLIVGAHERIVYDEILDHYPRIVTARRSDDSHALFVQAHETIRQLRARSRQRLPAL